MEPVGQRRALPSRGSNASRHAKVMPMWDIGTERIDETSRFLAAPTGTAGPYRRSQNVWRFAIPRKAFPTRAHSGGERGERTKWRFQRRQAVQFELKRNGKTWTCSL